MLAKRNRFPLAGNAANRSVSFEGSTTKLWLKCTTFQKGNIFFDELMLSICQAIKNFHESVSSDRMSYSREQNHFISGQFPLIIQQAIRVYLVIG